MKDRIGTKIHQAVVGESYQAYLPRPLPPTPPLDMQALYPLLERATVSLSELNSLSKTIPNISLFMYMFVRKEALLSSQIEGTQSSFADLMLFEHEQIHEVQVDDIEEVSYYVKALHYGLGRLKEGFPLSLRLIKETHGVLLSGGRGASKLPGEFRRSQNWIGGTRPGNALFVPPPPEFLMECLSAFENFLHDGTMPVLIKAGLIHVQFETIHPFLDGNGRLGRLLIILLLCHSGFLNEPILYLSLYLKQHRSLYYSLLQEVREQGNWEVWLEFFLHGIDHAATQGVQAILAMADLFQKIDKKIEKLGRARFSCQELFQLLKHLPQVSVPVVSKALNMSAPTARSAISHLVKIGVLEEMSGKKRDRIYIFRRYLGILEEGTEPL